MSTQVFYHIGCSDGIGSAWAMRYLGHKKGYFYMGISNDTMSFEKNSKYINNQPR